MNASVQEVFRLVQFVFKASQSENRHCYFRLPIHNILAKVKGNANPKDKRFVI